MGRLVIIDAQLRGRVDEPTLARFRSAGLHVHRVGSAAYVHDTEGRHRWLLVVGQAPRLEHRIDGHHRWLRGGPEPPWEIRRTLAWLARRARIRLRAPSGRFVGPVPWWAAVTPSGRLLTPRHLQPWRLS